MRLLDDNQERELTNRYVAGESVLDLCVAYGVSVRTARRVIRRHRDIIEHKPSSVYVAYRDGWPVAVEYTRDDLAEALGCATESIRRFIRRGKSDSACDTSGSTVVFVVPMPKP